MKEVMLKIYDQWKSGAAIDGDLLDRDFVYIGPSKMITTEVWKELVTTSDEMDCNLLRVICSNDSGAMLFEHHDEMTGLKYRTSWFLKFGEDGLLVELIETKESVET